MSEPTMVELLRHAQWWSYGLAAEQLVHGDTELPTPPYLTARDKIALAGWLWACAQLALQPHEVRSGVHRIDRGGVA